MSANDHYTRTVVLGAFPRNVLEFQESQDYLQQLIFVDYQLQLLVVNEFGTNEFLAEISPDAAAKLALLATYAHSIAANYNAASRSYDENLYYAVLAAQFHYLQHNPDLMVSALNTITTSPTPVASGDLVEYLTCRYHVLLGLANHGAWTTYLRQRRLFLLSHVAAHKWLTLLHLSLARSRDSWTFADVSELDLGTLSTASFAGYLVNHHEYTSPLLRTSFSSYLVAEIEAVLATKTPFPHATEPSGELAGYIDNLYRSWHHNGALLKASSVKKVLVNATSKTYQSQLVLAALIQVLIDLNEYDEAFAAFKTYISYVHTENELLGKVGDIVTVIATYSRCIASFNPLNSSKKFRYTPEDLVVQSLATWCNDLQQYLEYLAELVGMDYGDQDTKNPLLFLYHKFNVNILLPDVSPAIELISGAWSAVGYYHYFVSVQRSPTTEVMLANRDAILRCYKRCLVVNSTGNSEYLYRYALTLALSGDSKLAVKLCKFALRKFPEAFKMWNLMILTSTSLSNGKDAASRPTPDGTEPVKDPSNPSVSAAAAALNIAALYLEQSPGASVRTKNAILELKLTQIAVLESIHGTEHILELIPEVFILFHELFDVTVFASGENKKTLAMTDNKWSHRPSVIDASELSEKSKKLTKEAQLARDVIKKLKISPKPAPTATTQTSQNNSIILQDLWLWTSRIYQRVGLLEESEQCIVEAESVLEPNIKTYTALGYLTSRSRKFLSLQEFERSLELLSKQPYDREYGRTLLGLSKLFLVDDDKDNSLFTSTKDRDAGVVRLKNLLETYALSWPYGYNNSEVWYYLLKIYEILDDKVKMGESLWRCVELEDGRAVRSYV